VHNFQHRILTDPSIQRSEGKQQLHPHPKHEPQRRVYVFPNTATLIFFTIFLMLNFLIPITLNIVIEGVKTFSGLFLTFDRKLYDPTIKKECGVLNTSIIEELGVVDCVLTDKTGTLTANEMVFRKIAIRNTIVLRDEL
jgi:P-type E1-E2 ATPase